MIMLTRLNRLPFALNPDLIERAEATPDTVLTLCDGSKLLIGETVEQLVQKVQVYRAQVLALADRVDLMTPLTPALHVVPAPTREG